jgi:hypothetical protein
MSAEPNRRTGRAGHLRPVDDALDALRIRPPSTYWRRRRAALEATPRARRIDVANLSEDTAPGWLVVAAARRIEGKHNRHQAIRAWMWHGWAVEYSLLPSVHRGVLHVLAGHDGDEWSQAEIARRAGIGRDYLTSAVAPELERWGWLADRPGSRSGYRTRWRLTIPAVAPPDRYRPNLWMT